jgi:hypothetical protein
MVKHGGVWDIAGTGKPHFLSAYPEGDNMKLELTVNEVNTIMQALGNAPYVQVAELIQKIREQAQAQLSQPATEEIVQ